MQAKPQPRYPGLNTQSPFAVGLVAAWPFWDRANRIVTDVVRGYQLSFGTTSPAWVGSAAGGGLDFDGSDDFVDAGDVLNLGSKDFTVAALVTFNSDLTTQGASGRVIQKRGTGAFDSQAGFQMCVRQSTTTTDVLVDNTGIDDGTSSTREGAAGQDLGFVVEERVLLSMSRVGTVMEMRVNGHFISITLGGGGVIGSVNNDRNFTVGAHAIGPGQFASMIVDAVYVWNRDVSEDLKNLAADPFEPFRRSRSRRASILVPQAVITEGEIMSMMVKRQDVDLPPVEVVAY